MNALLLVVVPVVNVVGIAHTKRVDFPKDHHDGHGDNDDRDNDDHDDRACD